MKRHPTKEERQMFQLGGHNAQTLAVLSMAKRTGLAPDVARRVLAGSVSSPLPYVTPEEEGA